MDGFSAPSFSLGLDLDIIDLSTEGEQEEEERPPPIPNPSSAPECPAFQLFQDQEFDGEEAAGSEETPALEPVQETPLPRLKRLVRGLSTPRGGGPSVVARYGLDGGGGRPDDASTLIDDDIEEFSSPEDNRNRDNHSSVKSHLTGGAFKFSLQNRGVLTSQSTTKSMVQKISPASDAATSTVSHESCHKKLLQKPDITPIRKIHLLSSDSDNSSSEDECKYISKVEALKLRHSDAMIENEQWSRLKNRKAKEDSFWKDFSPKKVTNFATPALDQFCEDYLKSTKDPKSMKHREQDVIIGSSTGKINLVDNIVKNSQQKSIDVNTEQNCSLTKPEPPAFRYFYHDDARIQMLVKQRLYHFVPLGTEVVKQPGTENLNYMNQFDTKDVNIQARKTCKRGLDQSAKKGKKLKASSAREPTNAAGGWANPRNGAAIPKDAGKRRVCADSQGSGSGRWFTDQDGRKVYVTKNGQELTGQIAYRQYRKESVARFKKSKKKAASRKRKK